jgi:hypothetical protein
MRRLEKAELLSALTAWAHTIGSGFALADTLPPALEWLRRCWELGNDHLPLDLVHDLGHLLIAGREFRFASDHALDRWSEEERRWRLEYEDQVLGRWAIDPTVADAHVAIAGMGPELRDTAVTHAIGLALGDLRAEVVAGNSAFLRTEQEKIAGLLASLPTEHDEWKEIVDPAWLEWALSQRRSVLAEQARPRLFSAEDLWEIAHLADLPNEYTRLALREIHRAALRIGPASATTTMRLKRRAKEVPIDEEAADQYPAGGFESISGRGRFENLVRSEIAYVGEAKTDAGVDLFDVRFAQGELLYYTRDESPMLDARTEVTVVIDRPLDMRHKHAALPAQTLVMVEGLALVLSADLIAMLGPAGSRVNLEWLVRPEEQPIVEEERRLLAMTLAADIAHDRVRLAVASRWEDVRSKGRIIFSPGPPAPAIEHKAWVRVGEQRWSIDGDPIDVSDREGLREIADSLLVRLWA